MVEAMTTGLVNDKSDFIQIESNKKPRRDLSFTYQNQYHSQTMLPPNTLPSRNISKDPYDYTINMRTSGT
jgi:hypothetical protein